MNKKKLNKILVVDDATANLQLLTHLLTAHGYTVHSASNGKLALEFIQSTLPDLVFLGTRMPGMNSYEVCRRLKADERTHAIPIIFIGIQEDEGDKVKGFQAGAVDYISKPFQAEEKILQSDQRLRLNSEQSPYWKRPTRNSTHLPTRYRMTSGHSVFFFVASRVRRH